jgi:hypothetical protein
MNQHLKFHTPQAGEDLVSDSFLTRCIALARLQVVNVYVRAATDRKKREGRSESL